MQSSRGLTYLGVGICAENKPLSSNTLEVLVLELLNLKDGELGSGRITQTTKGLDLNDEMYQSFIERGDTVPASFLGESNLDTSYDLRRGEEVHIYQSGLSGAYKYVPTGRTDGLRRLETWRMRWSDIPENVDEELSDGNTYSFEVSTHEGHMTFHTSNRNGEAVVYTVQANGKDGQYTIKDDLGNIIQLDSTGGTIWLQTKEGATIEVNRTDIHILAMDKLRLEGKTLHLKSDSVLIDASSVHIKAGQIKLDGNVESGPLLAARVEGPILAKPLMIAGLAPVAPCDPYSGNAKSVPGPFPRKKG